MPSRTEELIAALRLTPVARHLIPQSTAAGWPIPLQRNDDVYAMLPFFRVGAPGVDKIRPIYPPCTLLVFSWQHETIVEYADLHFRFADDPMWSPRVIGGFPHPAIAALTVGEYRALRGELFSMYDHLFTSLASDARLKASWARSFSTLLNQLIEPALVPYYRAIRPEFVQAFKIDLPITPTAGLSSNKEA